MNQHSNKIGRVRWDDLSAFLAVARAGGLAGAAKDSGSSAPTLGRRMRVLERVLGQELFVRRSHGYDLTEAGLKLMGELQGAADQIARATEPSAHQTLPLVKVSTGTWTTLALARRFRDLTGDPPDVRVQFVAAETVLSIARREVSIAIRNQRPTEPGLVGRKLAQNSFAIYGRSEAPANWIIPNVDTPSARWGRARADQAISFDVSHPRLALDLALAGAGHAILPTFIGDGERELVRKSDPIAELTHDAWLVAHDDDRHLPEIRRVIDRICAIRS